MKIYVDEIARGVRSFTELPYRDGLRRYYDIDGGLVVCHGGLELNDLVGYVVDAATGIDEAHVGFVVYDDDVGQLRSKVTIWRTLRTKRYDQRLSEALRVRIPR